MLLLGFIVLAIVSVPLFRGSLGALASLRFRRLWILGIAAGMQVTIALLPGPVALQAWLHVASYFVAGAFFWANRRIPGLWLVGLGGALNLVAIMANGGVMPADPSALATAGLAPHPAGFSNSVAVADPQLRWLGDIFAVPRSFPLHNVFSIGDLTIALGAALMLHRLTGSRLIPSGSGQFRELRGHRDFMRLWAAQGVSNMGDWIYALAVVASIARRDVGAHALAILLIVQVGPSAVAGALGGPLVDRFPRKGLMVSADLLRGAAVASLLLAGKPSLVHLYFVAAALGLFGALFQPSLQASLPNVVPKERIVAANALVGATYNIAVMIGPVVGGFLVATVGEDLAFVFNALSFGVSALLLFRVRIPDEPTQERMLGPAEALVEGARYAIRTRLVRGVLIVTGLIMFGAAIRSPLEPLYVLRTLGGQPEALGLLGGIWGFGMILGSVAAPAAARRWRRERLFGVAVGIVGIAILLASQANVLSPVLLLWLFAGAGNGIGSVSYGSLLQERTPNRLRGRVMAASEAVLDAAFLLGAVSAGWLGAQVGVRGAFVVSGAIFLLAAILSQRLLLESGDEPAEELAAYPAAALVLRSRPSGNGAATNGHPSGTPEANGHPGTGRSAAGRLLELERVLSENAGMNVRIRRALKEVSLSYDSEEDLERIIARLRRDAPGAQ